MVTKGKIETYVPTVKKDKKKVRSSKDYLCKACFCYEPDENHAAYGSCHRCSVTIDKSESDWCFEHIK